MIKLLSNFVSLLFNKRGSPDTLPLLLYRVTSTWYWYWYWYNTYSSSTYLVPWYIHKLVQHYYSVPGS